MKALLFACALAAPAAGGRVEIAPVRESAVPGAPVAPVLLPTLIAPAIAGAPLSPEITVAAPKMTLRQVYGVEAPPVKPAKAVSVEKALKMDAAAAASGDPHAARRLRADRLIEAEGKAWNTSELFQEAQGAVPPAPSGPEMAAELLSNRAYLYERAAQNTRERSPLIGRLAANLLLLPRANKLRRDEKTVSASPHDLEALIAREAPSERREYLEKLTAYVPGLNPARVVTGHGFFADANEDGRLSGGYATDALRDGTRLVWIPEHSDLVDFIRASAHEGFHQGDRGYGTGERSVALLLGDEQGPALHTALIEGYTDWRARAVIGRLRAESAQGAQGLPSDFTKALKARGPRAEEDFDRALARHGYNSYVLLAEAILKIEGGRPALDALVSHGDISPLYFLLGPVKFKLLGLVASGAVLLDKTTDATGRILSGRMGLGRWLERGLADVVRGSLTDVDVILHRERIAKSLLTRARDRVRLAPSFAREGALWSMGRLDMEGRLMQGMSLKQLSEEIDRDASRRGLRRYLPDALTDWRMYSWLAGLSAVLSPLAAATASMAALLGLALSIWGVGAGVSLWRLRRRLDDRLPSLLRRAGRD